MKQFQKLPVCSSMTMPGLSHQMILKQDESLKLSLGVSRTEVWPTIYGMSMSKLRGHNIWQWI